MDCSIVKDLIPLYIDDCCSEESAEIVREHIASCPQCNALYESMKLPAETKKTVFTPAALSRINDWKASLLQSILLFVSFALITIGVAAEASTPSGISNGYWAVTLIIPSTGFMLSLSNWYFVRLYKSRKCFSNCSLSATLTISAAAYAWSVFHYKSDFAESIGSVAGFASFFGIGILLTAILCVLSKVLSDRYAKMLGKE